MATKRYPIIRTDFSVGRCSVHLDGDRQSYPLPRCDCHSPTGLNCGYRGSGPTDLGLSILADYFTESKI
jgi:Family of unknown function (DUF6166)